MSEAQRKLDRIRELLTSMETSLNDCKQILKGENQCSTCRFWSGSCQKGRVNRTASSEVCELFEPRGS